MLCYAGWRLFTWQYSMSNSSKTLTFAWHVLCISVCVPQFLLFLLILFNLGFFWATFLKIMKSRKDTCKTTAVPSLQSMYRYMYITPVHAYSHKDNRGHSLISFTHSIPVLPFFSSCFEFCSFSFQFYSLPVLFLPFIQFLFLGSVYMIPVRVSFRYKI